MIIRINDKIEIKKNQPPLLVAEISSNHAGSKKRLLKHIFMAHKCGADLIKIQTYEEHDISLNLKKNKIFKRKKYNYNKHLYQIYQKTKTPYSWHKDAFDYAKNIGATLFSTPFSLNAVEFLESINNPVYKLASLEITDYALIKRVAMTKKPIIMSTGASNIQEIFNALKIINNYHNKVIILYCVSGYPTPAEETNINSILYFKKIFKNNFIGLSDHTNNIYSSIAGSSLGISVIEKHFIVDNKKTRDSKHSITPKKFKELKEIISAIYITLGKEKIFLKNSEKMIVRNRRSLFAKMDIKKGEIFSENNIISLRPKVGMCSSKYFKIIGKKAKVDIKKFSPIFTNNL